MANDYFGDARIRPVKIFTIHKKGSCFCYDPVVVMNFVQMLTDEIMNVCHCHFLWSAGQFLEEQLSERQSLCDVSPQVH